MTYTFTGELSANLGSTPFSDASFTWIVIGDTSYVTFQTTLAPEPASGALMLAGLLGFAGVRMLRRRS